MVRDFHEKEFDVGTAVKLNLYRQYLSGWIPTFVEQKSTFWSEINICDFFCGKGTDATGQKGSPLIAIEEVLKYRESIIKNGHVVNFYFFDDNKEKVDHLNTLVDKYRKYKFIKIHCDSVAFPESFDLIYPQLIKSANMLFIDQFGVKHVTPEIILKVEELKGSDLIFYVASSFWKRFFKTEEFMKYAHVEADEIAETKQSDMHRLICDSFKRSLPMSSNFILSPFSIKKGANIYGLIHGSGNRLGALKFLEVCWKIDPARGEADFDIDDDQIDTNMPSLFEEMNRPRKIQKFETAVRETAMSGGFSTDLDVFDFSISRGFIATKHASKVIQELIKDGELICSEGRPRFSKVCIKEPRELHRC